MSGPGTADAATGLGLSASASCGAVRHGDDVRTILKIEGDGVAHLVGPTPGARLTSSSMAGLQWGYEFTTEQEGGCTFGPYSPTLNGQALTSTPVVVKVLPQWDGRYGTFFCTDRARIRLGETIELIEETWRSGPVDFTLAHLRLKSGGSDYDSGPSLSSIRGVTGAARRYGRQACPIQTPDLVLCVDSARTACVRGQGDWMR